jgi:hypothetical protein
LDLTATGRALAWLALGGAAGFAASAVFSGLLHWDRTELVPPYAIIVALLLLAYSKSAGTGLGDPFRRHAIRGLIGGIVTGLILVRGVMAQPPSPRPEGSHLLFALAWLGLLYGAIDALLLNVIPVLVVYRSMGAKTDGSWVLRAQWALAALAASLLVTAAYHLGYAEFQGPRLLQPLIGNAIVTLGYLLTGSPLAALVAHVIMHVAAVLHGMETTVQLPPHY